MVVMKWKLVHKFVHVLRNPMLIRNVLMIKHPSWFDDELYLKEMFRMIFRKDLNLSNPRTFNEKMNWLKLHDRNPLYTVLADKYWVKKYVANLIGEEFVVPCYGCWKSIEEIDFNKLPEQFFLKMNHDSQKGVCIDKKIGIDMAKLKEEFSKSRAKRNWFWPAREWGYKHIEPCILAEKFLKDARGGDLQDYKFWCFNGNPTYMYITNKGDCIMENFYDMEFKVVNIDHGFPRRKPEFERPQNFDLMKKLAMRLSANIPFVRIDFFEVDGKVYFGEFTFYDWGGMLPFADEKTDLQLGDLLVLPQSVS